MKTVYKYPVPGEPNEYGEYRMGLPRGAVLLHADIQHGNRALWAMVDTDEPEEIVRISLLGTGQKGPDDLDRFTHAGTFYEGSFVRHIFFLPTGERVVETTTVETKDKPLLQ